MEEKLEENDFLRLLLANRDIDLNDTQLELLKLKQEVSRRNMALLSKVLQQKYQLAATDHIDIEDGKIIRTNITTEKLPEPEEIDDDNQE